MLCGGPFFAFSFVLRSLSCCALFRVAFSVWCGSFVASLLRRFVASSLPSGVKSFGFAWHYWASLQFFEGAR